MIVKIAVLTVNGQIYGFWLAYQGMLLPNLMQVKSWVALFVVVTSESKPVDHPGGKLY